ncbi:MAG: hypothetical protein Q8K99_08775 [Actinomycetota bacterium]|nr:hypothetical protein [Actinomycetota bacterium]
MEKRTLVVVAAIVAVLLGVMLGTGCRGVVGDQESKPAPTSVEPPADSVEPPADENAGADIETDEGVTAGTELAGLRLYPDSAQATYTKFDFKEGDAQIHIQIDVVADGTEQEVIAWYQGNLAAELARRGWTASTIEMNAVPGDSSVRETSIMCNKDSDSLGGTFVNVFFEKSTGTKTPVTIVYQGPMPAN